MAKTYTLTATSINGGRKSSYEHDWRNFSANENKDAGRRNDDYKATNILFNATTLASLRSKPVTSIKLKLTITNGTIPTSASYARQLIGYKLNSTTTTSSAGSAWTRSDANSTAASGTVYAGQILAATEITSPAVVTFDLTGSSVPVYGYVIGPSRSSLSSYSYITISAATLEVITNEYDITYNANGGSGAPAAQVKTHGTALTLSSTIPTRNNTSTNYTVTYNAHGGSVSPASATVSRVTSYGFIQWNTKSDGTGTNYSAGGSYTANASATLYAQWESSKSMPIVTLPTPTWAGRTFNGWYTAESGGTRVGGGGDVYTPSANVTLHAQWTLKTYTVSYNKNGASGSTISNMPSSQTKTYGTDLTLSNNLPTRANESAGSYRVDFSANSGSVSPSYLSAARTNSFTFAKWNTKSDGTGTNYSRGGTYSTDANATLYARWTSSTSTAAITLPTPTRSGYLFNGWYTAASGGTRKGGGGDSYTPTAATTLYAQWSAQKSTVSTTNGTLGTAQTITITRNNSSFKHTLTYSYGSATGTIATKTTSVSVSWTPPTSLASQFPSATSGTCTITCQTFDGDTSLGTTTTTCSLAIPASIKPTISSFTATPQSSNTAISGWGVLVKGYSTVALSVSKTLNGGATLASIAFSGPGLSLPPGTSTTATTSTMTTAGEKIWNVIVTDSRGRTATQSVRADVYDYANPVISSIEVCRCNSDGALNNNSGTYIKFKPHFSVSSVNGNNGLATSNGAMLKWRVSGGSYGTAFAVTNDTWTAVQGGGAISTASTYEGQLTVTDKVGNSTTLTVTLPGSSGLWYGRGNDRLGLGSAPSGAGLYCDWDATFKGVVDVTQRRCYALLPSEGWYRVCSIRFNSYAEACGIAGGVLRFAITDSYDSHTIDLLFARSSNVKFANESSASNGSLSIDKIRYTVTGASPYNGYVDVHLLSTTYIGISFDYTSIGLDRQPNVSAKNLQSVDPSPSGETVLTEYTFAANNTTRLFANATKDSSFNATTFTLNCFVYLQIGIMVVTYNIRCPALSAGVETLMGTFPDGYRSSFKENFTICGQSGNPYFLQFYTDGRVTIYSGSASTDQFIRGTLTLPLY